MMDPGGGRGARALFRLLNISAIKTVNAPTDAGFKEGHIKTDAQITTNKLSGRERLRMVDLASFIFEVVFKLDIVIFI